VDAGAKPSESPAAHDAYYASAVTKAERPLLEAARSMEGLEEEIALLRVRLNAAAARHPEDLRLLTHGIQTLVRAVATQYRLSPKARKHLADGLAAVLNSFGDQILPADG
jgi:hypothetical protein